MQLIIVGHIKIKMNISVCRINNNQSQLHPCTAHSVSLCSGQLSPIMKNMWKVEYC